MLRIGISILLGFLLVLVSSSDAKALIAAPTQKIGNLVPLADAIITGKVIEIEKDEVDILPYPGAPANLKISAKVAVLRIEKSLQGADGLTQIRVAFVPDLLSSSPSGVGAFKISSNKLSRSFELRADMDGIFLFQTQPGSELKMPVGMGSFIDRKSKNFDNDLAEVQKTLAILDNPMKALKTENKDDRAKAATVLLTKYNHSRQSAVREKRALTQVPQEETQLLLKVMAEMPWVGSRPEESSRSAIFYFINPTAYGYKQPIINGGSPPDVQNKTLDEATTKFLNENASRIRISR